MKGIVIKHGYDNMDFASVTEMLAESYWSHGIDIQEVKKGAENSALVIGVFKKTGKQIRYAHAISDKTRYAYILDVIVRSDYRNNGIGKELINYILIAKSYWTYINGN